MKVIDWLPGLTIALDPDAVEDYEFDFSEWMEGETSIVAAAIHENCTASVVGNVVDGVVVVRVSEVTQNALVTVRVESTSGRRNDFTTYFSPVQQ